MRGNNPFDLVLGVNRGGTHLDCKGCCGGLLLEAEPDLDEVRKALNRIADDGRRAGEVLSSIRAMFGDGRHEKQSVKVNDLICDVLTLIHAELERQHVGLQMELSDGVFEIIADRVQLQQVLLNLFNNALEAMSSVTGRPRVLSVKSQTLEPSDIAILVEDCGAGIDPKNMDRIFDAFFTTKARGMGMGLSICRSIIEAHGGRLWASHGTTHGTIFTSHCRYAGPTSLATLGSRKDG